VPAGTDNMGVESAKEYIPGSRTPGECGSRSGSTTDERSLQLDAKPSSGTTGDGPGTNRPVCLSPDETVTNISQLNNRPRSAGNR